ncbi:MAG: acyl carrier protein [Nitrospiraceae bacterium]|nr:MAG: acyl carrier protein [Nitrospiraceae bacterium]
MSNGYEEELRALVSEIIEIPPERLTLNADFIDDLNVDSLRAIEIVAAFEKKYRLVIPEEDIPKIRTLGKLIEYTKDLQ